MSWQRCVPPLECLRSQAWARWQEVFGPEPVSCKWDSRRRPELQGSRRRGRGRYPRRPARDGADKLARDRAELRTHADARSWAEIRARAGRR